MKIVAIVIARNTSARLPGKTLLELGTKTAIDVLLDRLSTSEYIDQIIIAIPDNEQNDTLANHLSNEGRQLTRGSEENVLSRFVDAVRLSNGTHCLRITGDCPLIDGRIVDKLIELGLQERLDYCFVGNSFPDGLDAEFLTRETVEKLAHKNMSLSELEHVTSTLRADPEITWSKLTHDVDLGGFRLTLDYPEDYEVIKYVTRCLGGVSFSFGELSDFLLSQEAGMMLNAHLRDNKRP